MGTSSTLLGFFRGTVFRGFFSFSIPLLFFERTSSRATLSRHKDDLSLQRKTGGQLAAKGLEGQPFFKCHRGPTATHDQHRIDRPADLCQHGDVTKHRRSLRVTRQGDQIMLKINHFGPLGGMPLYHSLLVLRLPMHPVG